MNQMTIHHSFQTACDAVLAWHRLKEDDRADPELRIERAVDAVLALTEAISRGTMSTPGDLLSDEEHSSAMGALGLIRRYEGEAVFKRSLHHMLGRIVENLTGGDGPAEG